ncbi:Methyl-accepting chemotaxis protein [Bosea sp. 62]|uniref:methyl-accepting chemotaxis protein n=1 Tax=unclassified Bosea (in: a-proteobacteria) TaxID=2653178 RepID=UPI00125B8754|nr:MULTISPECIES: methyl-accepting chemotaxis protein [unclassified Bosea (in: a-proteobacteria)]CAD5294042.1 Methyl-accepting chemotaxis protein [Bosea sp. 7B]CAD5298109.1 Methyl-accepting chemotaxis protein [Bosea sp. 21B]CAD5298287.1 Methyl-accepting chemotaxis protein [Bosea sp. 46]VVT61405.1 Methyl-accepting chemotaxis protein [Bosea sp. EC-HK365B]VXB16292.1 Methyl-accepting chemotaxis protein [Bosea sp. 127]
MRRFRFRLHDLRIRTKIAIPMLVMGAIGIGSAVYGALEFGRIEKTYADLVSQRASAILDSARATASMGEIVGNLYQAIAYPEFMKQNATSIEEVKTAYAASLQALVEAKISFPQRAESFDELSRRLQATKSDIDQIVAQAARDEDLPALSIMSQLDKTISGIVEAAAKLNDEIKKDTDATSEALAVDARRVTLVAIGLSIAGTLLGLIGGALLTAGAITRPLERLKLRMGQIADGDYAVEVEGQNRKDEVGEMARAVQVFKENGLAVQRLESETEASRTTTERQRLAAEAERSDAAALQQRLAAEQAVVVKALAEGLTRLSQGDLGARVEEEVAADYVALQQDFNSAVGHLAQTIATIQATSVDVGNAAREINSGADDLSKRTEEQASSLEQTAATTEQLAASVKASAQASRQAVQLANEATDVAANGGIVAGQAVDAMARIEQTSRKISDITSVIDEIAFQTNLLALNAAVEAARAGDAGKGFAVVASEVRTLAQRSADAAKDIKGLIGESGVEVEQGVGLVRAAGEALSRIVEASRKVAATVSDISAAAAEQANGIDEMSQTVAHMDEMTQQNAALAEESAASATSLSGQIGRLNELVASFRTGGGPALANTQAAEDAYEWDERRRA